MRARRRVPGAAGSLPALALALALVTFGGTVISNQLSRAVEARADAFSLELTGEPRQFIALERGFALANVSDPDPPAAYRFLFGTHPSTIERIGIARAFERRSASRSGIQLVGLAEREKSPQRAGAGCSVRQRGGKRSRGAGAPR